MDLKLIGDQQKSQYNKLVTHVMQSWQWGQFRESLGTKVLRYGLYEKGRLKTVFQITFHKIPLINEVNFLLRSKYVGYLPKGPFPDQTLATALKKIAKENNCAFIKLEPNVEMSEAILRNKKADRANQSIPNSFLPSPKPLFTKYNFVLDLTKPEEELLKNLHQKTRYNIKIAQKHGVTVAERIDDEALEIYLKLYFETTKRQGYQGHSPAYHRAVWNQLKKEGLARLLIAFYQPPNSKLPIPLTAWMLLNFKDTLYYPYGGSSKKYPEVMANNLIAWEAIKLGKKLKLKKFDLWGALGPAANPSDPWYGFHRFKLGYGGNLVEYLGTFDLVLNWPIYLSFTFIDKLMPLKLFLLKLAGK